MNFLLSFSFAMSAGVVVYAVLTLPSWLFSSINRGCLWEIRDDVFDARRRGILPDSASVQELIERVEIFIVFAPKMSALKIWWLGRRLPEREPSADNWLLVKPDDAMNHDQVRLFIEFQLRVARVIVRQYLVGSWSGLLVVVPRHPRDLRTAFSRTAMEHSTRAVDRSTTRYFGGPIQGGQAEPDREREIVQRVEEVASQIQVGEEALLAAAG